MTTLIHHLAQILAPWQSAYSDSKLVSTTVTSVHIVALLFGGGLAIAADRATLRALRASPDERLRQLDELDAVHRPVLLWLAALFGSGVLLAAADVETFAASPAFWVKLALVALLVVNGAVLALTERRLRAEGIAAGRLSEDRPLWRRLRVSTFCSIALWTATAVAGTVLISA